MCLQPLRRPLATQPGLCRPVPGPVWEEGLGAWWRALPRPRRLRRQPDSGASACLCPRPQEASDGDGAVANCGSGPWGQYEASQQDGPSFRVLLRKRTPPKALSSGGAEFPSMGALRACPPSRAAPAPHSLPPGPLPRAGCGVGLVELLRGAGGAAAWGSGFGETPRTGAGCSR